MCFELLLLFDFFDYDPDFVSFSSRFQVRLSSAAVASGQSRSHRYLSMALTSHPRSWSLFLCSAA